MVTEPVGEDVGESDTVVGGQCGAVSDLFGGAWVDDEGELLLPHERLLSLAAGQHYHQVPVPFGQVGETGSLQNKQQTTVSSCMPLETNANPTSSLYFLTKI